MSELIYYNPDMVIIYDGWNDVEGYSSLLKKYGNDFFPLRTGIHEMVEKRMEKSYEIWGSFTQFVSAVGHNTFEFLRQFGSVELVFKGVFWVLNKIDQSTFTQKTTDSDYIRKNAEIHRDNWEVMILLSKFYRFKIALFLQPLIGVDGKQLTVREKRWLSVDDMSKRQAFYRDSQIMLKALKEKYKNEKSILIDDLSQCTKDETETIYEDSGHLLLKGNEIVARSIVERIGSWIVR